MTHKHFIVFFYGHMYPHTHLLVHPPIWEITTRSIIPKNRSQEESQNKQIENIEDFSTQLSLSLKTFGPRFYGAVEKICPRSLRRLLWKCPAIIWQHKTKNLIKTSQNIPVKNRRNKKRRERGKQFLADSYGLNVFVFMFNQI